MRIAIHDETGRRFTGPCWRTDGCHYRAQVWDGLTLVALLLACQFTFVTPAMGQRLKVARSNASADAGGDSSAAGANDGRDSNRPRRTGGNPEAARVKNDQQGVTPPQALGKNDYGQRPYKFIGVLRAKGAPRQKFGTATLIGPRHIITSATCIYQAEKQGGDLEFVLPDGSVHDVVGYRVNEDVKDRWSTMGNDTLRWGHDLAVAQLANDPKVGYLGWGVMDFSDAQAQVVVIGFDVGAGANGDNLPKKLRDKGVVTPVVTARIEATPSMQFHKEMSGKGSIEGLKAGSELFSGLLAGEKRRRWGEEDRGGPLDLVNRGIGALVGMQGGAILGNIAADVSGVDDDAWATTAKPFYSETAIGAPILVSGGTGETVIGIYNGVAAKDSAYQMPRMGVLHGGTCISGPHVAMISEYVPVKPESGSR